MSMETAAWVLTSIAGVCVLLVLLLNIYSFIRPRFPITVNCWFCSSTSQVPYINRNSWNCHDCEQYNGFLSDGGYNKVIPAQHERRLNEHATRSSKKVDVPSKSNGFCRECNINQELKVHQLASFIPYDETRYDEEVEKFRVHLERSYQLCSSCDGVLVQTLRKQKSWLLGLKISQLRDGSLLKKVNMISGLSRLASLSTKMSCSSTTLLSAWLLVAAATRLEDVALPASFSVVLDALGLSYITVPSVVHLMLASTVDLELYLSAAGAIAQLFGTRGNWKWVDVSCAVLWLFVHGQCWLARWSGLSQVAVSVGTFRIVHTCTLLVTLVVCMTAIFQRRTSSGLQHRNSAAQRVKTERHTGRKSSYSGDELTADQTSTHRSDTSSICRRKSPHTNGFPNRPTAASSSHLGNLFQDALKSHQTGDMTLSADNIEISQTSRSEPSGVGSKPNAEKTLNGCGTKYSPLGKRREVFPARERDDSRSDESFSTRSSEFSAPGVTASSARTNKRGKSAARSPRAAKFSPLNGPNDISDLLNDTMCNVSLPVSQSTPEDDNERLGRGIGNLNIGSHADTSQAKSPLDRYADLFATSARRRPVISPSRLAHTPSPWTSLGRNLLNETTMFAPLSRSSSQSSGFASQSSQTFNSRPGSVDGDFDNEPSSRNPFYNVRQTRGNTQSIYSCPIVAPQCRYPIHPEASNARARSTISPRQSEIICEKNASFRVNHATVHTDKTLYDGNSMLEGDNAVFSEGTRFSKGNESFRFKNQGFLDDHSVYSQGFDYGQRFPPMCLPQGYAPGYMMPMSPFGMQYVYPGHVRTSPIWDASTYALPRSQLALTSVEDVDNSRPSSRLSNDSRDGNRFSDGSVGGKSAVNVSMAPRPLHQFVVSALLCFGVIINVVIYARNSGWGLELADKFYSLFSQVKLQY